MSIFVKDFFANVCWIDLIFVLKHKQVCHLSTSSSPRRSILVPYKFKRYLHVHLIYIYNLDIFTFTMTRANKLCLASLKQFFTGFRWVIWLNQKIYDILTVILLIKYTKCMLIGQCISLGRSVCTYKIHASFSRLSSYELKSVKVFFSFQKGDMMWRRRDETSFKQTNYSTWISWCKHLNLIEVFK